MGDGRLLRVQLPVRLPAVASEDVPLVVDRIELRQEMLLRLQHRLAPLDLLLPYDRTPLASKVARPRMGDDRDLHGLAGLSAALHSPGVFPFLPHKAQPALPTGG